MPQLPGKTKRWLIRKIPKQANGSKNTGDAGYVDPARYKFESEKKAKEWLKMMHPLNDAFDYKAVREK